jgi:hypothetical protein
MLRAHITYKFLLSSIFKSQITIEVASEAEKEVNCEYLVLVSRLVILNNYVIQILYSYFNINRK